MARRYGESEDSGIEDMDWTCGCKYCQVKENVLSHIYIREHSGYNRSYYKYSLNDLDPLKFEIQENCLFEDCKEIKYVREYGFCSDIKAENKLTCLCKLCTNIRKDLYLYFGDNLKAEPACLSKLCRDVRTQNDP